jgi:hypothetical protein
MVTVIEPNYNHYSRVKSIDANEAQWLLAIFELRDREFRDQDEFDRAENDEKSLAEKVLIDAFNSGDLKDVGDLSDELPYYIYEGRKGYYFNKYKINFVEFCTWADELEYNLPDELVKLIRNTTGHNSGYEEREGQKRVYKQDTTEGQEPNCDSVAEETQKKEAETVEGEKDNQTGAVTTHNNNGGRPEGSLAEAVRYTYEKLHQNKDEAWRLKKGNVRDFIEYLKFMATESNPNADKDVMERIAIVKSPQIGDCTIKTQERKDLISVGKRSGVSRTYNSRHVTRILMRLREEENCPE